jgi:cell division protein FtsL
MMMKKKIPNRKKKRSNTLWLGLIFIMVFIGELFFYTWCRVQCTRMGYEISRLESQHEKLVFIKGNLQIESARLKSPERIARTAMEKLGLMMPTPKQMVIMP